ncbi:MAG: MotA/TolQ/ExbB proton channel family protein [Planctomycetota bacterium]
MNAWWVAIADWFARGGPVMWVITVDGLLLFVLLCERWLALCSTPPVRRGASAPAQHALDHVARQAEAEVLALRPELTRHFALIRALIAIAPLLGLLGTVGGMIAIFEGILVGQRVAAAASGIGAALITTQYGLAVAVPGLLCETLLLRRRDGVARGLAQARAATVAAHGSSRIVREATP